MTLGSGGRRVGVLGGAFNPPHLGHLRLAELAWRDLGLDEVRFIPTALSPHKPTEGTGGDDRLALLEAALAAVSGPFVADPLELERGGVSWTVDTLERLAAAHPGTAWIVLTGSDQLPGLPRWHRLERLLELASLAVALRPGHPQEAPEPLASRLRSAWSGAPGELVWLPGTDLDLASRALRETLSRGLPPEGLAPQVRDAIARRNLYAHKTGESE